MKIKNFIGVGNEELKYDRDFEMNCIALSPYSNEPVKKVSVKTYFSLIRHYDEINKKRNK